MARPRWPAPAVMATDRLRLEPLRAEHATEAFPLFDDVRLHAWTGGAPAGWPEFAEQYRRRAAGQSPDGGRGWLNWLLRHTADQRLVGLVQATLYRPRPALLAAELAWVIGSDYQGRGFAREAAIAMTGWLAEQGVGEFTALIHPGHAASIAIARRLALTSTGTERDGEVLWIGTPDWMGIDRRT